MSEPEFSFRPLERGDFSQLLRWFNAPHAVRWYGRGSSIEAIEAEYLPIVEETIAIRAYIASLDGAPIGMIERVRLGDFDEYRASYRVSDPNTVNCDIVIGEPRAAHRGLGSAMLRAFIERFVFADPKVPSIVIDPWSENVIAIRSYEKAGFRFVRALADDEDDESTVYLLELRREDMDKPVTDGPFFIRPARAGELATLRAIDEDACQRYAAVGMHISSSLDHAFTDGESRRWQRSIDDGRLLIACASDTREPVGFVSLALVDRTPFVQQVSVRRAWQGRGVGRALIARAKRWSVRAGELWLTTYAHVAFNAPWYERLGFQRETIESSRAELRALDAEERRALPAPEQRVAMCYRHRDGVEAE